MINAIELTNEVIPLITRAIETGDSQLLAEARSCLPQRQNTSAFFSRPVELEELYENITALIDSADFIIQIETAK